MPATAHCTEDASVVDYLRVLYKRRWTAIAAFLIVFGSSAVYTFTATPIFSARTQVLIENENPNVVKFEEVLEQNKGTNDYYQTQYRILQSRALARRTLDAEKLWNHPLFSGTPKSSSFSLNPIAWVGGGLSYVKVGLSSESRSPRRMASRTSPNPRNRCLVERADGHTGSKQPPCRRRFSLADRLIFTGGERARQQYIEQIWSFAILPRKATPVLNARTAESEVAREEQASTAAMRRPALSLEDRQNIVV